MASVVSDSVRPHRQQPTRLPYPWDSPGKNIGVGCHFLLQCMKVKSESEVAQSRPTPSDPMDCSLPGSSVHGILQARVLEWVAIDVSIQQLSSSELVKHGWAPPQTVLFSRAPRGPRICICNTSWVLLMLLAWYYTLRTIKVTWPKPTSWQTSVALPQMRFLSHPEAFS